MTDKQPDTLRAALAAPQQAAPAMPSEIALMEKAARRVGITSLLNHGAASCVYSEGCAGVSQEHLLAYTREIALHCAVALAAPQQAAPAAEWLEQAYREGWAACRDAETIGEEAEDWAFGNSAANSRMIDMQQAAPQQEVPAQPDDFGSAEHWKEKAQYWAGVAHRLRGEALRGEPVDGIIQPPTTTTSPKAAQPTPSGDAEDAQRWRMAVLIGNEVMQHPDKRTNAAAVKAYMDATGTGSDLTGAVDAAIDAARKEGDKP